MPKLKSKTFVIIFFLSNLIFLSFNFLMWELATKNVYNGKYIVGDLGSRIGYSLGSIDFRKTFVDLPIKHFQGSDLTKNQLVEGYDILTIGDSFSNGASGGKNPFYQDYIASIYKKRVLNIPTLNGKKQIETIATLVNSGYIDKIKPKYIIIQTVERNMVGHFGDKQNMDDTLAIDEITNQLSKKNSSEVPTYSFINSGNYKFLLYDFLRYFNNKAFFSECYSLKLDRKMFNVSRSKTLLFYKNDISKSKKKTDENIYLVNQNLNQLQQLLKSKGIKLVFMPAPDKYTVYYEFLKDKKYGNSQLFEKLSHLKQKYIFINTKEILTKKLQDGEQDLYYADDTHWSYKASEAIVKTMGFLDH